nr:putative Gag-Pol polyprotein [Tanacetum cinerariifolium]
MEQMTQLTSMCEMACQIIQKKQEEKKIEEEQAANARYWKILACCDDDDDYNSVITPNEPVDSLTSTPMETHKTLLKDEKGEDLDEHLYRSMIGSLMYLSSSRPDFMFATVVVNSTTAAEYIAASSCSGQAL